MAKRSGFDGVFLDGTTGLPLIGLDIAVYNSSGSTLSTIYETKQGNTLKTNPFQTSSGNSGLVQFWAEPGYYEVEVSDTLNRISSRRIPFDAVAGDMVAENEGIDANQIDFTSLSNKIEQGMLKSNSISTEKIQNDAVTADKLKDDATVNSNRAVTTNHIRNDAVTADKLSADYRRAFIITSYELSQNNWNTVASLGVTPGVWVLIADINYGKAETASFYYKIWGDSTGISNNDVYVSDVRNYGGSSFAFGWSNIWTVTQNSSAQIQLYPTTGKQFIGRGTSFVIYRIG